MSVDEFSYELNMLPLIFFYDTGCGAGLPLSRRLLFITPMFTASANFLEAEFSTLTTHFQSTAS